MLWIWTDEIQQCSYILQRAWQGKPMAAPVSSDPPDRSPPCRCLWAWEPNGTRCAPSPCRLVCWWWWSSGFLPRMRAIWLWRLVFRPPLHTGPPPPTWNQPGRSQFWLSSSAWLKEQKENENTRDGKIWKKERLWKLEVTQWRKLKIGSRRKIIK